MGVIGFEIVAAIKLSETAVRLDRWQRLVVRTFLLVFPPGPKGVWCVVGCYGVGYSSLHQNIYVIRILPSSSWGPCCTLPVRLHPPPSGKRQQGFLLRQSEAKDMVSTSRSRVHPPCQYGCDSHAPLHAHRAIHPRHSDGFSCTCRRGTRTSSMVTVQRSYNKHLLRTKCERIRSGGSI